MWRKYRKCSAKTFYLSYLNKLKAIFSTKTRIHFSRMRIVRCSGRLSCHACPLPCMPPSMHTLLPHMPPAMHTPCHMPTLPHMPPGTHATHTPPATHVPPGHACQPPCTPPCNAHPPAMHAPAPVDRMTDACENIAFPQLLLRTVKMEWPSNCQHQDYYLEIENRELNNLSSSSGLLNSFPHPRSKCSDWTPPSTLFVSR